jgi:4-hydroxy-2-oxovalerate/4-hydroxy-2-oxohexanoate aldolase
MAADCGVGCFRVATHCTEADVAGQHIGLSRQLGVDTVGFLMMAHMVTPEQLLAQAKILEGFGASWSTCTDSAGFMLPDDVSARDRGAAGGALARRRRLASTGTTT